MIKLINKDKKSGRVTFRLENTTPAFANSLRRLMMESVPTMAIEEVEFAKNDGALYDEILAHRLGLLPLTTDLKDYDLKKVEDELNAKNSVKLTLKAKGPCMVYAEDLKSKDPAIKPVHGKTPLVKLLKGQELEFEATAVLGTAKEHVKFAPCLAWYVYEPKIAVNNNHKDFDKFKDKFPPQIFANGKIDAKLIEKHNLYEACDGVHDGIVHFEKDPTTFIFTIEPWGQLAPHEILASALDTFGDLLSQFSEAILK
ncbi:DNA-directed RNA polymerase subunit D [Candidatus Woesearchaeota archaeon]|nr:DNA-directed RNA polymerase subunit D [Candidatus Woesearchaeota archaeon]